MNRYGHTPPEAIEKLVEAGLLTERQAQAYVYRDIDPTPRHAVAEMLGISVNVLDKHLSTAREKVDEAEATVDALEAIRHPDFPDECSVCSSTLGGQWALNEDDDPVCLECADVDPDDLLDITLQEEQTSPDVPSPKVDVEEANDEQPE